MERGTLIAKGRLIFYLLMSITLIGLGGWYFAVWCVRGAFQAAGETGLEPLTSVLKATVGATVARGDERLQLSSKNRTGALNFYNANVQLLGNDKDYFETWSTALTISQAAPAFAHTVATWHSSADMTSVPKFQQLDAWNHTFCVKADEKRVLVVSGGPHALSPLKCNDLHLGEEQIAAMSPGRLNPASQGAVVLLLERHQH